MQTELWYTYSGDQSGEDKSGATFIFLDAIGGAGFGLGAGQTCQGELQVSRECVLPFVFVIAPVV